MNLKKNLESKIGQIKGKQPRGQAIVEYIAIFTVLAAGIIIIFGGFNPDSSGFKFKGIFNAAVNRAIEGMNRGW